MVVEGNFSGDGFGLASFPGGIMDSVSGGGGNAFLQNRTIDSLPLTIFLINNSVIAAATTATVLPMFSFPDSGGGGSGGSGNGSSSNEFFSRTSSILEIPAATITATTTATNSFSIDNELNTSNLISGFGGDDLSSLYSSPATVFGVLMTFSLCTIFGNSLVMLAVSREDYLKTPPNYFVASLAAADFSVGVLLVPFEAITQLLNRRWIFGNIFCELWHSMDVLLSTASILNLCVISLDRYWAICTPMSYPRRMTSKRAIKFIALTWILAIVISLPAIFWWRSVRKGEIQPETCPFTEDVGYLVSSSCISFYIPLSVMLFAYFKIYKAAVKQSKSIQAGAKLFPSHDKNRTRDLIVRMHRGGGGGGAGCCSSQIAGTGNQRTTNNLPNGDGLKPALSYHRKSISFGKSDPTGLSLLNDCKRATSFKVGRREGCLVIRTNSGKRAFSESGLQQEIISEVGGGGEDELINLPSYSPTSKVASLPRLPVTETEEDGCEETSKQAGKDTTGVSGGGANGTLCTTQLTSSQEDAIDPNLLITFNTTPPCSPSSPINNNYTHNNGHSSSLYSHNSSQNGSSVRSGHHHHHNTFSPSATFRRQSRRSFTVARLKIAKFAKEKKAAKTLAIVLGVFIICWLPFFVINIIFAVCKSCAEGHLKLFEVVTWLGWINSAMNPVIYACWSPDLRRAFARLLGCGNCVRARQRRKTQRRLSVIV